MITLTDVTGGFTSTAAVAFDITVTDAVSKAFVLDSATSVTVDFGTGSTDQVTTLQANAATTLTLSATAAVGTGCELDITAGALTSIAFPTGFDYYITVAHNVVTATFPSAQSSIAQFTFTGAKLSQASVHALLDAIATSGGAAAVDLSGGTSASPSKHAAVIVVTWSNAIENDGVLLTQPNSTTTESFYIDNGLGSDPFTPTGSSHSFGAADANEAAANLASVITSADVGYTATADANVTTITAKFACDLVDAPNTNGTGVGVTSFDSGAYSSVQTIRTNGGSVTTN